MTADPKFAKPPATEKTVVYRVLKRHEPAGNTDVTAPPRRRWDEQEPLAITSEYPYATGRIVGEKYGEGDYIILPPISAFQPPWFLTVVADRYYREAEDVDVDWFGVAKKVIDDNTPPAGDTA